MTKPSFPIRILCILRARRTGTWLFAVARSFVDFDNGEHCIRSIQSRIILGDEVASNWTASRGASHDRCWYSGQAGDLLLRYAGGRRLEDDRRWARLETDL